MTVNSLSEVCKSQIKVLSAYDGRVLCRYFNPKKHTNIGDREVLNLWADIDVSRSGFTPYIGEIISIYVHDDEEYINKKERAKHDKKKIC